MRESEFLRPTGFLSTADDLARFGVALTGGTLVDAATAKMMFSSQRTTTGEPTGTASASRCTRARSACSLARIETLGADQIYCDGDLVGYGPHPNEVCAAIRARAIPTIYGNYDYAIGRGLEDCGCAYVTQHDREIGQRSVDWTLAHTNQQAKP